MVPSLSDYFSGEPEVTGCLTYFSPQQFVLALCAQAKISPLLIASLTVLEAGIDQVNFGVSMGLENQRC